MSLKTAQIAATAMLLGTSALAQSVPSFDPFQPFIVSSTLPDGRVHVQSGGQGFVCRIAETNAYLSVTGCKPVMSQARIDVQRELAQLRQKTQTSDAVLADAQTQIDALQTALESQAVALSNAQALAAAQVQELAEMRDVLVTQQAEATAATKDAIGLKAAQERAEADLAALRKELNNLKSERDRLAASAANSSYDANVRALLVRIEKALSDVKALQDDEQQLRLMARAGLAPVFERFADGCTLKLSDIEKHSDVLEAEMMKAALSAPGVDKDIIDLLIGYQLQRDDDDPSLPHNRLEEALETALKQGDTQTFDRGAGALRESRTVLRDLGRAMEKPEVLGDLLAIDRDSGTATFLVPECN